MYRPHKIGLIALFCVLALTAFKCGGNSVSSAVKMIAKGPNGVVIVATDATQVTPKGVPTYGKFALSPQQLAAIDQGIDELHAADAADGFTKFKPYAFYGIYTPPYACQPSPIQRIPSFLVRGDNYDGSDFDQYNTKGPGVKDGIGVVFAAEMVMSLGTPGSTIQNGLMYVCPDISVLHEAVRNGGEHIDLANFPYTAEFNTNERYRDGYTYFWCSIDHLSFGHPLIPRNDRCLASGFVSRPPPSDRPDTTIEGYPAKFGQIVRAVK